MQSRARIALVTAVAVLCVLSTALAQDASRVIEIEVVGNRVATPSLILGVAAIDRGSPLTPTVVQESIHRLYSLGIFSDVTIQAEEVPGGLKVYVVVKELPKLSGLDIVGNDKIDTKDLKGKIGLSVGGYISPFLIQQKTQAILDAYGEKGYFQAEVTHSLVYNADSTSASLTYNIKEHSKVKVERVVMTGNKRVEANDLIKKMRNRKRGFLKSSDFAQDKYEEDLVKVIEEYHKKGFIDAYLVSDSTSIDTVSNRMTVWLDVYEGPLYYFGKANFKSTESLTEEYLAKKLKFDEGDPFNSEVYEESLYELYTAYQDIGHLHIRVADDRATRNDSIIDITYDISEGLPSHINMVKIVGNNRTKDKVIRRELSILPGMVFNRQLLIRSVRDAMALNFFANVEPVPVDLPNGDVDLEFKVEEKQTGQISAGAGYNSEDKVVGNVGMGIPNFRGNGQNLSFNIEFGSSRNSFSVSFTEPWLFGRPTLMGTELYSINRRWYDDYNEARQGGSLRLGKRLRWPDNYFRVYASYRLERTRYNDFDDDFDYDSRYKAVYIKDIDTSLTITTADSLVRTDLYDPYPGSILEYNEEWNTASRIAFTISRDSRNLPEFATSGSYITYTFENTGGPLGGFWKYQKHELTAAKFIPIWGNLALAAKVQFGAIRAPDGDDNVLVSDRFTPGGTAYDGIVRGYDDGDLTPDSLVTRGDTTYLYVGYGANDSIPVGTEPDSVFTNTSFQTRVRGNYMLVTNIELQFPLIPRQLYVLGFYDAGNSWLRHQDFIPRLYQGVGLGFRLMVPGIGTIGFDFAYPLDTFDPLGTATDTKRSWKPHFQVGTTFR